MACLWNQAGKKKYRRELKINTQLKKKKRDEEEEEREKEKEGGGGSIWLGSLQASSAKREEVFASLPEWVWPVNTHAKFTAGTQGTESPIMNATKKKKEKKRMKLEMKRQN